MNSTATLRGQPAHLCDATMPTTDGRLAMELTVRSFWQSRATHRGTAAASFEVVNLPELAKEIRHAFYQ